MSILRTVLGPASKYDRRLPYTYEARVRTGTHGGPEDCYVCDTLCGVLERLAIEGISPADTTIVEVRAKGETDVQIRYCVDEQGKWLRRPEACRSFAAHYVGHDQSGRCCYRDRSRVAEGPFERTTS